MTTFAIIVLTVLSTIIVLISILVLSAIFDKGNSIEQMYCDKSEKLLDDKVHTIVGVEFVDLSKVPDNELEVQAIQEGRQLVNDLFKKLNSQDTESITSYLENLEDYKVIIDESPNKFLNYHFQNSIRDEQYELSKYISDVAKKRGMILKAE